MYGASYGGPNPYGNQGGNPYGNGAMNGQNGVVMPGQNGQPIIINTTNT